MEMEIARNNFKDTFFLKQEILILIYLYKDL